MSRVPGKDCVQPPEGRLRGQLHLCRFFAGPAFGTLRSRASKIALVFARLAQSVEHETLNLRVVGSSPTLGAAFAKLG